MPRFVNLKSGKEEDFIRGYAFDFSLGGTPDPKYIPAYGAELERRWTIIAARAASVTIMGEVLPRYENHVSIDKNVVDALASRCCTSSASMATTKSRCRSTR